MKHMFKPAVIGVVMLALTAAAISARDKIDCDSAYKSSLDKLKHKQISPERLAVLNRRALRIYDACQTGDLKNAKSWFESLESWKDSRRLGSLPFI